MPHSYNPVDVARFNLINFGREEFLSSLTHSNNVELIDVSLHYYQSLSILLRRIDEGKIGLERHERTNLKENRKVLRKIRSELEREGAKSMLEDYSEGIVVGAIVSALRENEADITRFDKYQALVQELVDLQSYEFRSHRVRQSLAEMLFAVQELEGWLSKNAEDWFPLVKDLSEKITPDDLARMDTMELLTEIRVLYTDLEIFSFIAQLVRSNPLLIQRIQNNSEVRPYPELRQTCLMILESMIKAQDCEERVKSLGNLFLKQIEGQ